MTSEIFNLSADSITSSPEISMIGRVDVNDLNSRGEDRSEVGMHRDLTEMVKRKRCFSGLLNKQVAGELEITESTLKAHRGQVMQEDEGQLGSRFGGNDCETPSECCPKPFNEFWVVKV